MSEFKETDFGLIPDDWEISSLGQICNLITDGSHSSPKPLDSLFYMASVKDMRYDHFDFSDCKTISKADFDSLDNGNCSPQMGDILLSKDGANCLDLIFVYKQSEKIVLLSSIAIARLKEGFDPDFYRFFLLSPNVQFLMRNNFISGSAIPRVVLKDFRNVPVPLIPLDKQKAIATVLCSLDDKINLLHRQNTTLEAMAETLFRQWFVEEAKEDWEECVLNDVISIKGGTTPSTKESIFWNGNIHWTTPRDLSNHTTVYLFDTDRKITEKGLSQIGSGLLPVGIVLLSSRAPIGYLAITEIPMAINQGYIAILCDKTVSNYFIYLWCKVNLEEIKNSGNGSVFQEISKSVFKELKLVVPPKAVLNEFKLMVEPMFLKIKSNQTQIRTLTTLRDTLLPKLMSGEVRVEN